MSRETEAPRAHAMWRGAYRWTMRVLPGTMREKHGDGMQTLFARELERSAVHGTSAVTKTAAAGLIDLVRRGFYERVIEERAALHGPGVANVRRLASAFVVALVGLTGVLVTQYAVRWSSNARMFPKVADATGAIALYAIPFTVALTLPMAVFVAVLWASTRRDARGLTPTVESGATNRASLRLAPLTVLATVVTLLAFGWNAEVVPRANTHLASLLAGGANVPPNDRMRTLSELRVEGRRLAQQQRNMPSARAREAVVSTDVEIHKKPAIAAACLVFALLAAGTARRLPRAGIAVQAIASVLVFTIYYVIVTAGESLADRFIVPPVVAMWSANVFLLGVAVVMMRVGGHRRVGRVTL